MDQAEQLRNVIKLHNQNNQNNARVVTITSGKGGCLLYTSPSPRDTR